MVETVNYFEHDEEGMVKWLLLESLSKVLNDEDFSKLDPKTLQVELKINGKVIPFVELIEQLEQQHKALVVQEAKELLEHRFMGITETIDEIEQTAKEQVDDLLRGDGE